jgi:hypothetical protein
LLSVLSLKLDIGDIIVELRASCHHECLLLLLCCYRAVQQQQQLVMMMVMLVAATRGLLSLNNEHVTV